MGAVDVEIGFGLLKQVLPMLARRGRKGLLIFSYVVSIFAAPARPRGGLVFRRRIVLIRGFHYRENPLRFRRHP